MGENENLNAMAEETNDGFMDGWDSPEPSFAEEKTADQPENLAEDNGTEDGEAKAEDAGQDEERKGEEGKAETADDADGAKADTPAQGQGAQPKTWNVKYLGEDKVLAEKDITPEFLQKAMDYDRIRGKYDEFKPTMELFASFAKQAGMSVEEYTQHLRTEVKKANGMDETAAKREIALEDREAVVAAKEAEQNAAQSAANAQKTRVDNDLSEFKTAFPETYDMAVKDPKVIPESVWADVRNGMSLTAAYARYAVTQAEQNAKASAEKAQSAEQNAKNAARSTGSMKSAGNDNVQKDDFLLAFGD